MKAASVWIGIEIAIRSVLGRAAILVHVGLDIHTTRISIRVLDRAGQVTQQLLRAELTVATEAIDVRDIELRFDQNTAVHADLFVEQGEPHFRRLEEQAVERALAAGARIVGVTNRNLRDFGEDLSTGTRLAGLIPADVVAVAESAIRSVDDARAMADAGFSAVLVGEHLVRSPDPEAAVAALAAIQYREGDRCVT